MSAQVSHYDVRAGLQRIDAFDVVGLSAVIKDRDAGAEQINTLWEKFFSKSIGQDVPNRMDEVIYAVYSDYEGDHTKPYRLTIGYKVEGSLTYKSHLHHVRVQEADYALMGAAGEQPKALIETWTAVWQSDLERRFETDFEVYGQRFFEAGVHEVLVAIGVNLDGAE